MFYNDEDIKIYNNENNKINNYINNNLNDNQKIITNIEELKIGDKILITFIPDSQKYIYNLYNKFGIISSINNDEILIINLDENCESILHENVSYFGNSLGYSYDIYKFI